MGFFDVLKRIAKGQKAFVVNEPKTTAPPQSVVGQQSAPSGPKVYPQVYIERVDCRTSDDDMEVEVTIQNYSQGQVEVDKIEIFGRRQELDTHLRPGEEREFKVYDGKRPTSTSQSSCRVYYKDQSGDYFASEHYIEFRKQPDNTYAVDRMRFLRVLDV